MRTLASGDEYYSRWHLLTLALANEYYSRWHLSTIRV